MLPGDGINIGYSDGLFYGGDNEVGYWVGGAGLGGVTQSHLVS